MGDCSCSCVVEVPRYLAALADQHRNVCSIIRGNDYIFRSEEQQHSFNYPVQAGTNSKDTPIKDAQRFNIKVQKDDVSRCCVIAIALF